MATLKTPQVRLTIEQDGTDDLLVVDVQTDNRDAIQWDVSRGKRSWPMLNEAPMLWLSFVGWHALRRTGAPELRGMDLDTFLGVLVQVEAIKHDGTTAQPDEVTDADVSPDPTVPAA